MTYYEQLGHILDRYLMDLRSQVETKIKDQIQGKILNANGVEYKIKKVEEVNIINIPMIDTHFHTLFAPEGCSIEGVLYIRALVETPVLGKEAFTTDSFNVHFKKTKIKYNFAIEKFSIEEDINIHYATK